MNIKRSKNITIGLVCTESDVPVVMFELNDRMFYGLIDTGSETTIFSPTIGDMIDDGHKETKSISIVGFNGKRLEDMSRVSVDVKFLDWKMDIITVGVKGIVSDMSLISDHFKKVSGFECDLSAIFGSDFLQNMNARIDFQNRKLVISQ